MSRALYLFVAFAFLFNSAAFAYRDGERSISSFSQGTKRNLDSKSGSSKAKAPKAEAPKAPKAKAKSPKAPKAPKSPKTPTAPTATPAPASPGNDGVTSAPSTTIVSAIDISDPTPSASPTMLNMTCAIDDDCEDGFFCMEKAELCCEYNTTCLVFGAFTSSAPAVNYNDVMAGIVSGLVLMVTLW